MLLHIRLIEVQYVDQLIEDRSGRPIPIAGNALLQLTMRSAQAHNDQGPPTAPPRVGLPLPNVKEVVRAGDFEAVLTYGIGLAHRAEIRVITLN